MVHIFSSLMWLYVCAGLVSFLWIWNWMLQNPTGLPPKACPSSRLDMRWRKWSWMFSLPPQRLSAFWTRKRTSSTDLFFLVADGVKHSSGTSFQTIMLLFLFFNIPFCWLSVCLLFWEGDFFIKIYIHILSAIFKCNGIFSSDPSWLNKNIYKFNSTKRK